MALVERARHGRPSADDRQAVDLPMEFDAEALVDDMLGLSEWMRDCRESSKRRDGR